MPIMIFDLWWVINIVWTTLIISGCKFISFPIILTLHIILGIIIIITIIIVVKWILRIFIIILHIIPCNWIILIVIKCLIWSYIFSRCIILWHTLSSIINWKISFYFIWYIIIFLFPLIPLPFIYISIR